MNTTLLRVGSTLLLLALTVVLVCFSPAISGLASLTAFGPGSSYSRSTQGANSLSYLLILIPALSLWIPHRAPLVMGFILIILPTLMALLLLFFMPLFGILAVLPFGFWYVAAFHRWKEIT